MLSTMNSKKLSQLAARPNAGLGPENADVSRAQNVPLSLHANASVGGLETVVSIPLGKLPIVEEITQRSRSSIYADVKAGTFPRPIRIGRRSVAWNLNSVYQWVADRSRECDER